MSIIGVDKFIWRSLRNCMSMPNKNETGSKIDRRSLLKKVGAAGVAGATGMYGMSSRAAAATTPRTVTDADGNVFLGGDFFELGIREEDGGFGPDQDAPDSFFGSDRGSEPSQSGVAFPGQIGMYANLDGFADTTAPDYQYDYFLPGSPDERWSAGYRGEGENTVTNGRETFAYGADATDIPTSVTATSSGNTLSAELESTFNGVLNIKQTYSFKRSNRFFRTDVVLKNVGEFPIDDVRYQRAFDPDNGKDVGCEFTTTNTIVSQQPTSDEVLVKAEIADFDSCALASVSKIPIFYFSQDDRARVSTDNVDFNFMPSPAVYANVDYDNPPAEGTAITSDIYIAITFDVGTLEPGESANFTFFTALTDDVDETRRNIEGEEEEECTNRRNLSRGEEDEECPFDRDIERGGSRDELDRTTGRGGGDRHRDSATARRGRGRGE